jgi:cytochrome d ubiquinol oxidase subunit I
MVILYGALILWLIFAGIVLKNEKLQKNKALLYLLIFSPLIPFLAIQSGWMVAEIGRQPWVVYGLLQTSDAISMSVSSWEILITIVLFVVFYVVLFVAWLRIVLKQIKDGPQLEGAPATKAVADAKGGE